MALRNGPPQQMRGAVCHPQGRRSRLRRFLTERAWHARARSVMLGRCSRPTVILWRIQMRAPVRFTLAAALVAATALPAVAQSPNAAPAANTAALAADL